MNAVRVLAAPALVLVLAGCSTSVGVLRAGAVVPAPVGTVVHDVTTDADDLGPGATQVAVTLPVGRVVFRVSSARRSFPHAPLALTDVPAVVPHGAQVRRLAWTMEPAGAPRTAPWSVALVAGTSWLPVVGVGDPGLDPTSAGTYDVEVPDARFLEVSLVWDGQEHRLPVGFTGVP